MFLLMNYEEIKKPVLGIVSNKRYQWVATILVLLVVLMMSSSVRLSNWDLLTDSTTGEKIPLALDPYYFLRIAETIVETDGDMPEFDSMRHFAGGNTDWHSEIMPDIVVLMWKASGVFGDYTLREINVFSPVFFFAIGLILFFILVYVLTKSKFAGVLACSFLAFTPAYLYRTMAGFSDHEAIGMVGFFAAMLGFALALKYMERTDGKNIIGNSIAGGFVGLLTALTIALWTGVSVFLFMIIPIAFLLFWILNTRDKNSGLRNSGILFYISWVVFTVLFSVVLGFDAIDIINKFFSSISIISIAILGFIILDRLLMFFEDKFGDGWYNVRYRVVYSILLLVGIGIVVLPLIGKNFFGLVWEVINRLLNPSWGGSRVGSTVAENAQPYLSNWIGTVGKPMFALFVAGILAVAINFSEKIKVLKGKILMIIGFLLLAFGILFSRVSSDSILNGAGILSLSGLFYLGGLCFFIYAFVKNYSDSLNISSINIFIFAWMFVMLIVGRSTTRLFFVIAPFMCFIAAYLVVSAARAYRGGVKDEIGKIIVVGILIISLFVSGFVIYSSYDSVSAQAKHTGPSANAQWQGAMEWVRNNTSESAVFSHWWDYGYWVQTLGKRATVADGGHFQSRYDGNFKIGRYVLTTPQPETALSFFKTMDVDYLLIDQTDLGKYGAYSKIGGGNDEAGEGSDRYSGIPVMPSDPRQTVETANGTRIVFSGGMYLYEDIIYEYAGENVFLPAGKAAVAGVVMDLEGNSLRQPEAVYIYNNVQTRIPVRYIYFNGELIDFGDGLEVVVDIIPAIENGRVNPMGAAIYLSQKVSKSLFAQMFLLNDAFGNYESLELVHSEDSPIVASLKAQGAIAGDFVYYQGFRGPIKIWDVSEVPDGIKVIEEFRSAPTGEYGYLDGFDFGSR
jgi:asparagine N-glycosylation enzyme membrane subunit Stt3